MGSAYARLFNANETAMTDEEGYLKQASCRRTIMKLNTYAGAATAANDVSESLSAIPRTLSGISKNTLNDHLFVSALRLTVEVTYDDFVNSKSIHISSTKTKPRYMLTPEILSQKWDIGLEAAKRTLRVTTQRRIKTVADASISHHWGTNDRSMRYNRLKSNLFTDYMFTNVTLTCGNNGGQVYNNDTDWIKLYPILSRGDCHATFLDLLAHREGVPDVLISEQAKEQARGQMQKKVREAGECEPYRPFQNRAEAGIHELK
jgi:hypothetical protein